MENHNDSMQVYELNHTDRCSMRRVKSAVSRLFAKKIRLVGIGMLLTAAAAYILGLQGTVGLFLLFLLWATGILVLFASTMNVQASFCGEAILVLLTLGSVAIISSGLLEYLSGLNAFDRPNELLDIYMIMRILVPPFIVAVLALLLAGLVRSTVRRHLSSSAFRLVIIVSFVFAFLILPQGGAHMFLRGLQQAAKDHINVFAIQKWLNAEDSFTADKDRIKPLGVEREFYAPLGWWTPKEDQIWLLPEKGMQPFLWPLKKSQFVAVGENANGNNERYTGVYYGARRAGWGVLITVPDSRASDVLPPALLEKALGKEYIRVLQLEQGLYLLNWGGWRHETSEQQQE